MSLLNVRNFVLGMGVFTMSASAFAVKVKDCPGRLRLEFSDPVITKTLEEINEEARPGGLEENELAKVEEALEEIENSTGNTLVSLPLDSAKKGKCIYLAGDKAPFERIVLYTNKGRDWLFAELGNGPGGIVTRMYTEVSEVKKTGLKLVNSAGSLALGIPRNGHDYEIVGGPLVFVGKVQKVKVATYLRKTI